MAAIFATALGQILNGLGAWGQFAATLLNLKNSPAQQQNAQAQVEADQTAKFNKDIANHDEKATRDDLA